MRLNKLILFSIICISFSVWIFSVILKSHDIEVQKKDAQHIPNQWMFDQRVFPFKQLPIDYKKSAQNFIKKNKTKIDRRQANVWQLLGPDNIGGRITDIEVIDQDTNHILVGTASGGIFESLNSGATWAPIFDDAQTLSIGDIAVAKDSSNLIYVGTGEPNSGGGSITYDGDGIYKSTDGGDIWENKGLKLVGSIAKVAIHPKNKNIVFAACMGPLFAKDSLRGIYRTKDGGESWDQVLFLSDSTGGIDVIIDPLHPDTIYAAFWERIRSWNKVSYGGHTSGIYRSINGGDTWIELTNGLPNQRFEKGRIGLSLCDKQPNILYAYYVKRDGNFRGIFKTSDHGENWEEKRNPNFKGSNFYWWFGRIFVDPSNPDIVFATGLNMRKSEDGGNTWIDTYKNAHVDHHTIYIHPKFPEWSLNGNDGGLYKSRNGGESIIKLNGLPISQFYTCEIDPIESNLYYGGAQDNSTMGGKKDEAWSIIYRGDGFYTLVDPIDNRIIYTEYQYGRLAKSTNKGKFFAFSTNGVKGTDRKNWNTPVVFDPNDSKVLYYGSNRVYRSKDAAKIWTIISPDLSNGPYYGSSNKGTITSISISPLNSNIIYAGTDDGLVHYTLNQGKIWHQINEGLPQRWVTRVACDPRDEQTAYVCFSGYRHNDYIAHLFKTTDHGEIWTDISGNLPDIPINDIIIHSMTDEVFIATDMGVFKAINDEWDWDFLSEGMPNVVVSDIDIHEESNQLIAATFGRSMYRLDIERISTKNNKTPNDINQVTVWPNPVGNKLHFALANESSQPVDIIIQDFNGQILEYKKDYYDRTIEVNLMPGIYLLTIIKNGEINYSEKIIKR